MTRRTVDVRPAERSRATVYQTSDSSSHEAILPDGTTRNVYALSNRWLDHPSVGVRYTF
jgi:hypothetical protein